MNMQQQIITPSRGPVRSYNLRDLDRIERQCAYRMQGRAFSGSAPNEQLVAIAGPYGVAGCVAWFDLQDTGNFTQSGGALTGLTNKMSGVVWNTGTLPAYSTTAMGGTLPGLDFDGTTQFVGSTEGSIPAALNNSLAHTVFIVCQPDNADRTEYIFSIGTSTTQTFRSKQWGKTNLSSGKYVIQATDDAGVSTSPVSTGIPTIVPQVIEWRASTTQAWIQLNGAAADPSAAAFSISTLTATRAALGVRYDLTPDGFFDGKIGEILIYNTELSSGDRSTIRVALGTKWSISVTP